MSRRNVFTFGFKCVHFLVQSFTGPAEVTKFHYCKTCGILNDDGKHASPHFKSSARSGFVVLHDRRRDFVYVAPTFSSVGSITTSVDLDARTLSSDLGWLWLGKAAALYGIAAANQDLCMPSRTIMAEDYNYREIKELYDRYLIWYSSKVST